MARRVVLGLQNDGSTIGLRVSAAGYDALTAADDGDSITFDTSWTDISKIHIVGVSNYSSASPRPDGGTVNGFSAIWTSPGYVPFTEIRRLSGTIVYDDWWSSVMAYGNYHRTYANGFWTSNNFTSTTDKVLYIAYKIPVSVS